MQHELCPALGKRVVRSFEQLHIAATPLAQAAQRRSCFVRKQCAPGVTLGIEEVERNAPTAQCQQVVSEIVVQRKVQKSDYLAQKAPCPLFEMPRCHAQH